MAWIRALSSESGKEWLGWIHTSQIELIGLLTNWKKVLKEKKESRMIPRWGRCRVSLLGGRNCDFSSGPAGFDL